jgi:signal transduction histidine kinase
VSNAGWLWLKRKVFWADRNAHPGSLVGHLIRLASVWFILALVVTSVTLTGFFHQAQLERFQQNVGQLADNLYSDTDLDMDGKIVPPSFFDTRTQRVYSGLYWQVSEVGANGEVVVQSRSRSLWNDDVPVPANVLADIRATPGVASFYDVTGPQGEPLRAAAIYTLIKGRAFVFVAAEDRTMMDAGVRRFGFLIAIAMVILALGSLAAIFLQVRIGLRPLFKLTGEIQDVREGRKLRLDGRYPTEIMPVANQINGFLDSNQEVLERQRTHVGNLAHALKTPLSVLLTSAQDADENLPDIVRRQTETMRGQVDHHLRRARAAARSQTMGERTPIEPVLDELAVTLEQVFRDKDVVIDWRAPEDLAFRGEKQDFQEIIGNLIENACIWCRKNIRVTAVAEADVPFMTVTVEDDGPGMPEERYEEVLKRGARLDESAPGSGLGLSIVDELVRAYGGELTFDRATIGGLKVTLKLPGARV